MTTMRPGASASTSATGGSEPPGADPAATAPLGDEFRLLADNLPALVWMADASGYIFWYNRRWHEYCGTTPQPMEGWGWQSVHDPAVLPEVLARWRACIAEGAPFEMTFPLRGADGVFRPFLTRVEPFREPPDAAHPDGRVTHWFGTNYDVSAQLQAEAAVRAERDRSRRILDSMAEGFALLDFEFRILAINAEGLRLDARPAEALIGRTHWEAYPGSQHSELGRLYRRAMAERVPASLQHRYEWEDGRATWIEMRAYPVDEGLALFFRDITRTRLADDALRESEANLRALNADLERRVLERSGTRSRTWQVSPDLVGVLNARGYFETSNPAWQTVLGWSEAELARTQFLDLLHPDDVERTRAGFELTLQGQPAIRFENRYRRKDGGYRWISWVGVPEHGVVYCTGRDVTEEKQAAAALAEQTAERDYLWQSSPDLLVVLDFAGVFRRVNPAWTTILGYEAAALIGTQVERLVHPDDIELTRAALTDAAKGPLKRVENRYRHADGSFRWIDWVAAPKSELIFATGRHVTAEREQAAALAQAEEALRQAQKMEAVGQLTGGLAHDFNNLLTGITGSLELLATRLSQGRVGELARYITAAQGAAKRAAALTHRLLAFSRRQTLDPRPTDVNRLVSGLEEFIRRTAGPAITVEMVAAGGLWNTLIDPGQLENALLNLCINARDAMPDGGRLTIETGNRWLDERAARERDLEPGQYVSLCVSDTGSGMPPEVAARAFDPFFTTKPIGMGTGLGLSMVYGFVRQSGGQARIYSEPGHGAMVCLYLPRHHGDDAVVDMSADPAEPARAREGETVLVVDDEPTIRMLVAEVLGELGYATLEAGDGPAGLKILRSDSRVDLLITDVGLPGGMNGRQVAEAGRILRPGLKVLFITGYAENAVLGNGHLDPGMHVVTKPFAMDALAARIRAIVQAG